MIKNKSILLTGSAGFIGFHLVNRLLSDGWQVVGLDSLNEYYDVRLKYARLAELGIFEEEVKYNSLIESKNTSAFKFIQLKLEDAENMHALFEQMNFGAVCNLAAQAGVRYSIENPMAYINSNVVGFTNILEQCRIHKIEHLVFSSSSSVYGLNEKMPFSTHDAVNHPVSLYAATKKSNELMAHVYSKIYNLPVTGLRFFTVYGPWGRPDMSPMLFADAIMHDKPIKVFNYGNMDRDFTYVDDIVEGVSKVISSPAEPNPDWNASNPDPASSITPYRIYNIGNSDPVKLIDYIETLENAFGKKAVKDFQPLQPGDVVNTYSDMTDMEKDFDFRPKTDIKEGIKKFASWYMYWDKQK